MTTDTREGEQSCPSCGSTQIDEGIISDQVLCDDCGLLFDSTTEVPEEHLVSEDLSGLDFDTKEGGWKQFAGVQNATQHRLKLAFQCIEEFGDEFCLSPRIRRRSADVYAEAVEQGLIRGRAVKAVATASVHLAARESGYAVPTEVMAEKGGLDSRRLHQLARFLQKELDREPRYSSPVDFLPYLCSEFGGDQVVSQSKDILKSLAGEDIGSKQPAGFAAASVYLAEDTTVTQRE
ncbi:MAG: hypothetical protein ABEI52_05420, partial [Halobacteriaceae archaeon]